LQKEQAERIALAWTKLSSMDVSCLYLRTGVCSTSEIAGVLGFDPSVQTFLARAMKKV